MPAWRDEFLERCCDETDGAAIGDGAFGPGPALWVGKREVATSMTSAPSTFG
ncbi:MAG: hypothetical protein ACR2H3_16150 [Acidimicrobiales bacterium]